MQGFYKVLKKLNGRMYEYWQRTYRVGGAVKTENKYIGPAQRASVPTAAKSVSAVNELHAGQFTIPLNKTKRERLKRNSPLTDVDKEYKELKEMHDNRGFLDKLAHTEESLELSQLEDVRRILRRIKRNEKA
jgi:hypothetical protein